jgi:hypothetical protein
MKKPRRYAVFFGEVDEAYFIGNRGACEQFIREAGDSYGWRLVPLALCTRKQTEGAKIGA